MAARCSLLRGRGKSVRSSPSRPARKPTRRGVQVDGPLPAWRRGRCTHHGSPRRVSATHWGAVKEALEQVSRLMTADVVFAPRPDDAHQDHRLIAELAPTVWRDALVLHYEIEVGWRPRKSEPLCGARTRDCRRKVELLHECFPSQAGRDWWDDETFMSLMRIRGVECRSRYAEGFTVTKAMLSLHGGGDDE